MKKNATNTHSYMFLPFFVAFLPIIALCFCFVICFCFALFLFFASFFALFLHFHLLLFCFLSLFFTKKNYLMVGHVWLPSPNIKLVLNRCQQSGLRGVQFPEVVDIYCIKPTWIKQALSLFSYHCHRCIVFSFSVVLHLCLKSPKQVHSISTV